MYRKSPAKVWRKYNSRYSLIGNKSKQTGEEFYPPVFIKDGSESIEMPRVAKLVTWSKVEAPPSGFEKYKPYFIGILEFSNGERLTAQLVDIEDNSLAKGDIFIPTFRKYIEDGEDGIIHYGLKWTKA